MSNASDYLVKNGQEWSIVIPEGITEISKGVFNGCDKVRVICPDNSAAARYCDKKNIPHSCK